MMSQEVDEALVTDIVTKIDEVEADGSAIKNELTSVDVLVCGLCHIGFHFVAEFQQHKDGGSCKKMSTFREQTTEDNKPQIVGFLLWKYSQSKTVAENPDGWKVYQMWCSLPDSVKNCWIEAGKTINTYEEFSKNIPNKLIKLDQSSPNGSIDEQPPPAAVAIPVVLKPSGDFPSGQEFVVEKVVARRFNQKRRQFEYLLKWEGYPPEQNTWEPAENMSACTHLIKQYEDTLVKNGGSSSAGKRPGPGRPRKMDQIQNIGVMKPKVSPQAVEQIGIGGRPVRSSKQKAMDQVKYWCGTMKANEEVIESKPTTQNMLKRDYVMLEEEDDDEDIPVLKKKYYHQDSEDEDWDPSVHKSNASISENEEPNSGKIIARGQLTMEERIKYNVSRSISRPSIFPILNREERIKKIKTHLNYFNNVHRNGDSGLLQISPHLTQVTLAAMKGFVKLETNQVPQSGIFLFSNSDGFTRLNDSDKTQCMMMMMKHRDEPKKSKIVYAEGAQALLPPKKTLDLSKAREAVNQSSPLMKSYTNKKPFVPTKIQAAVKPRPFLHKVAAANPEYEKSLLQKHQVAPGMKAHHNNNMTFVPRRTVNNRVQQGAYAFNTTPEQLEFWEDTASGTDDGGLSDHFPSEDVTIPPNSPNRALTLCPTTGKRLMKAEGEKTPEPTPPSSPKPMISIDEQSMMNRQNDNSTLPTIIKLEPGTGNLGPQSPMVSINESEKVTINRTPQMNSQPRQSFVNYKDIPAASNSGLRMKKTNPRPNNSNKSLHVSSGISKSHNSLNVPARKIQHKQQETQLTQQFPGQQAILTDESGRLILSADDADSMITITGDDGMLYQVSAAQLAASGGTVLLAGNGDGEGQQCVFLTEDGNSIIQPNTNQEGMMALDDFGNSVGQIMPQQIDLGNLVTDDAGNMYMKDNETGQYVPVSATEQGGQVVIQPNENFVQEPQVMQDDQDQMVAQIVDAGEPTPGGGPRRVVLQLPDGSLMVTEMDEEQFAALEMDK